MGTLSTIVAVAVAPAITEIAKRYSWAKGLAVPINVLVSVALFVGVWAVVSRDLATIEHFVLAGMSAAGATSAGIGAMRRVRGS